jgi:hypothetical protein
MTVAERGDLNPDSEARYMVMANREYCDALTALIEDDPVDIALIVRAHSLPMSR